VTSVTVVPITTKPTGTTGLSPSPPGGSSTPTSTPTGSGTPPTGQPPNPTAGCEALLPLFCVTSGEWSSIGSTQKVNKDTTGAAINKINAGTSAVKVSGSINGERIESLLPDSTVPVPLSSGSITLVNPSFLVIVIALFIAIGIVGLWIIFRIMNRKH
jgi:hypothetical protein